MIVTLTPNPAVDQTVWVDRLEVGAVNRARRAHVDPAGKGVNVSRMVNRLGWPTIAFGFLAGDTGNLIERALDDEGVHHHFERVPGETRVNTTVMDAHGGTSLYLPGPEVSPEALARLREVVRFWLQAGRVLVLAGSLPPGMPADAYAGYVRLARERGVPVLLDADGEALAHGLAAGPDLIKPNLREAEALLGRHLPDDAAVIAAGRELARQARAVVLSLGARGAVAVQGEDAWHVTPPAVDRRSTVGSGDSLVAGLALALARGEDLAAGLRLGTAAGAATAASRGTAMGTSEQVARLLDQVRVERLPA